MMGSRAPKAHWYVLRVKAGLCGLIPLKTALIAENLNVGLSGKDDEALEHGECHSLPHIVASKFLC